MKASTPLSLCSIAYLPLIVLRELHAWNPLGPRTFGERRDTHFRFSTRKSFSALSKHDCSSSKFRQKKEPVILCAEQGQSYSGEVPRIVEQEGPPAISVPVFRLATVNANGSTNMNVITYACPVGIEPERLWVISLYKGTMSHENFFRNGWGVLQLLRRKHASLVPILGQASGRHTDKAGSCSREGFGWYQPPCELLSVPRDAAVLPDCTTYLSLRMITKQVAGDHDAVICRVVRIAGPDADRGASASHEDATLETRHLREAGII